ncbi:hypothetical protein AeMF1_013058 [Aphanomyces euteiches]|nr:hypothetical protein AeMF1_013058 [Aphanomyces euteiches]KAH9196034.1 hypothetical protein AeNC1_001970 [Aphanomyces euteiches]
MPLICYEGVDVDVPNVDGVRFFFQGGKLAVECINFTGTFFLNKPLPVADVREKKDMFSTPIPPKFAENKKRASSNEATVGIFEEIKRQKVETISPDDKQPHLSKAMHFLESEKENIFGSEDELELLLTQREASMTKKPKAEKAEKARTPLKQLVPQVATGKEPKKAKVAKKDIKNKKPKAQQKLNSQGVKLDFFSPKAPDTKSSTEQFTPDMEIVDMTADSPSPKIQSPPLNIQAGKFKLVETKGTKPSQRWGCSATVISNQRVVVYGGEGEDESTLSDLFVYDITKHEWSTPLNCASIPRTWHDAVFLEQKNLLLVFGGERVVGDGNETLSDLMVLDTECFLWYPPAVSGTPPMARSGHTCTVLGSDVVVFGGSRGRTRLNTLHLLDTETWNWRTIKVEGKAPSARTYHSAVAMGPNQMVIFGGNDSKKSYDSVHVLQRQKDDTWSWFNPCVVGNGPNARTGQAAIAMNDRTIIIHGGWDPQSGDKIALFGDVFTLDTESWEWSKVSTDTKEVAMQRVGHVGVKTGDNTILFFGGQDSQEVRRNDIWELAFTADLN